jgi:DNA sulfur modification protein DndE
VILETIRISAQGREQLIRLKRHTGIENWNVLCRWAFCVSLAEATIPPPTIMKVEGGVEMTWRTFGGQQAELYLALLRQRCLQDKIDIDDRALAEQFRLHLHRGLAYLAANKEVRSIGDLVTRVILNVIDKRSETTEMLVR